MVCGFHIEIANSMVQKLSGQNLCIGEVCDFHMKFTDLSGAEVSSETYVPLLKFDVKITCFNDTKKMYNNILELKKMYINKYINK